MSYIDVVDEREDLQRAWMPVSPPAPNPKPRAHCEIRYIDEMDVPALARAEETGDATFIAAELAAARTADERIRMIRGILNIIGFIGLGYAAL